MLTLHKLSFVIGQFEIKVFIILNIFSFVNMVQLPGKSFEEPEANTK